VNPTFRSVAGVVALAALHAPVQAADDSATVVLIGHAAPLTGQLANMGKDSENPALRSTKSTASIP
jgi:branched-chain amino acid transport system substrate-binding protein